jgi:hypothetical protein
MNVQKLFLFAITESRSHFTSPGGLNVIYETEENSSQTSKLRQ